MDALPTDRSYWGLNITKSGVIGARGNCFPFAATVGPMH
jgi:hypothetical protein